MAWLSKRPSYDGSSTNCVGELHDPDDDDDSNATHFSMLHMVGKCIRYLFRGAQIQALDTTRQAEVWIGNLSDQAFRIVVFHEVSKGFCIPNFWNQ